MNRRSSLRFASIARLTTCLLLGLPLLLAVAPVAGTAATHETVTIDPSRIAIEPAGTSAARGTSPGPVGTAMRVRYPAAIPAPVGAPDLPRVPVWIEVPAGMRVTAVKATPEGLQDLGRAELAPVAPDQRIDQEVAPKAEPDPAIYGAAAAYPGTWAELGAQSSLRGHWLVSVLVTPVQWNPATKALSAASEVRIELELRPATAAELAEIAPRTRIVKEIEAEFEAGAAKFVRGFIPATPTESLENAAGSGPAGPGPYQPSFRPTADGSAVAYVIVTSQALANEFQRLADWKTQKGIQTVVRTVEWIDQMYPNGADRAERIRFFIRDAYQNWGTAYVLLGGDSDVIPVRYSTSLFFGGESIPSDIYFGCLDGNWNGDGDAKFGEGDIAGQPADNADLSFEVSIGRAPVSTLAHADTFNDKTLLYDQNPPNSTRYPHSLLVLAERLFPATHGADVAEQGLDLLPPWIRVARLYEESGSYPGSVELTRQASIDSINAGFGIVHHVGHGYRNTMSVGSGTLNNSDADNLTNGPRNSVVFAINCSSASIDFNSIGERWVKNPNGGSIAYIGTSRLAFISASITYQNEWFSQVWEDSVRSIGWATDAARLALLPGSNVDGVSRWNLMATTLLGDPEADIYANAVIPIQVSHPANVALNAAPITVTVMAQGTPVPGATVTLWKANDAYVRGTTSGAGTVQLPITATGTGPLTVTVHKGYYRPYTSTINVTAATGPYLHVNATTVDDDNTGGSSGDSDGQADAGEVVELRLTLRNAGTQSATSVSATLAESDPDNCITITPGAVSYGTIAAGGQSQGTGAFLITISDSAPVACQPVLTVNVTTTQGSFTDQVVLPLRRPYLEHYNHTVDDQAPRGDGDGQIEADETIFYRVNLKNTGQDRATNVTGSLVALQVVNHQPHPLVTIADASSSFGTILPDASVLGDRFEFTLAPNCDPKTVLLQITLADGLGPIEVQLVDTQIPVSTDSVTAFGSPTSIRLTWKKPGSTDVKGYDILRSSSPGGPFNRINTFTVNGSATYEDPNLSPLTRYYYQIVSRDSSYNASVPSPVISGTTNPPFAAGWPIEMGQQSSSSAVIIDMDGGSHTELLCGGEMVNAWHGDGNEVVDGDQDTRTNGPFSLHGLSLSPAGFAATPAVGDVTNDGQGMEVADVGFTRDSLFVWNKVGQLLPGWPKWVMADLNWGSPLMADLNNDGDLELVVWSAGGGRLFAWHHTGVELVDGDANPSTNGVLTRITGNSFNYGSAAIAQLDNDPAYEILAVANNSTDNSGGIYAVNIDGSAVLGWPFFTGNAQNISQISSSPAVGDVDRNGTDEVIVSCERDGGTIYVLNRDGSVRAGWPKLAPAHTTDSRLPSPSLADLNNDGFLDVVFPSTNGDLFAWDRNGVLLPGFPVTYLPAPTSQATQCTAAIGDVDGNGDLEIFFGDEKGRLNGYNHDGTLANGFPIQLPGEIRSTPALWDLDRDGLMEIAVVCFDGNVYVWDMTGAFNPLNLPWPFFRHDTRNTGRYATPVQPVGIADDPVPAPIVAVPAFHPAHPNPFNPSTVLAFDVPGVANGARPVTLDIFDVAGRLVRRLVDGPVAVGQHSVTWDGRAKDGGRSASGIYFAKITIADFSATQKLTLVK